MDFVRLNTFLLLAELGSFTEVANEMFCSQPAVSKQIKALEDDLGVPLFNRIGHKNHLTIQGEYFKPYAQEILNTFNMAKKHILQLENLEEGSISFGATNFIGVYLIPQILSAFREKFPNIKINFTISSSKKLISMLENDGLEFAFFSSYVDLDANKYIFEEVFEDKLKIIVSSKHPLAKYKEISFTDFEDETFILKGNNSSLTKFLEEVLGNDLLKDKSLLKISNQEGIKEAVIKNLGVSIMSERAIVHEKKLGIIKTLNLKNHDLKRTINLVYSKKHNLTPAAKEFFKCINF